VAYINNEQGQQVA